VVVVVEGSSRLVEEVLRMPVEDIEVERSLEEGIVLVLEVVRNSLGSTLC